MLMTTNTAVQLFGEDLPTPSNNTESFFLESYE